MAWPDQIFKWLGYGKYQSAPVAAADGATAPLLIDPHGRLQASVQGVTPAGYNRAFSSNGQVVLGAPGSLIECWGRNDSGSAVFLQFHNLAGPPSGGATPLEVFKIDSGASFSFGPSSPIPFATGIVWVTSTTLATFTGPAGSIALTVVYR
jgi:hypothetical protein